MENYLNIIHFCLYKAIFKLHLFTKKINPFRLLLKLPVVKKKTEKEGVDLDQSVDLAWGNKGFGLAVTYAGGFLWGGMALLFFSILMMFRLNASLALMLGCGVVAGLICYVFVFKRDKYIKYFDKFEKWSKREKRKYGWLTVGSIIFILLSFYICLVI